MAEHTVQVKIAQTQIKAFLRTVRELRTAISDFGDAVDKLNLGLAKNVTQIRKMLSTTPSVKYAKAGQPSKAGGGTGGGTSLDKIIVPPGAKQFIGPNPPKPVPPKIENWRTAMAEAIERLKKGNVSGAGGAMFGQALKSGGVVERIAGTSAKLLIFGSFLKMLLLPIVALVTGIIAVVAGFGKLIIAISGMIVDLKRFQVLTLNSEKNSGRVRALSASLGLDREKVAKDLTADGSPEAFYNKLEAIRRAYDEYTAVMIAKSFGMEEYAGVYAMSQEQYDTAKNSKDVQNQPKNAIAGWLSDRVQEMVNDLIYLKEEGLKGLMIVLGVVISLLAGFVRVLKFVVEGLAYLNNFIFRFFGRKNSDKMGEAADKLKQAADAQLRAAGMYGSGLRAELSLRGSREFRHADYDRLRNELKGLRGI